jgi:hypothetical protein
LLSLPELLMWILTLLNSPDVVVQGSLSVLKWSLDPHSQMVLFGQWCVHVSQVTRVVVIVHVFQWDEDEFTMVTSSHLVDYTPLPLELQHQSYPYAHSFAAAASFHLQSANDYVTHRPVVLRKEYTLQNVAILPGYNGLKWFSLVSVLYSSHEVMGLFCLIRVSGGAFTQGILLGSLQEIQWEITLNNCLSAWVLVIVYQKKYVIVDAIALPDADMKDQTVSSYQFNFKCDKVAILRLVHDEPGSQGSCDICDGFYLLSPWCISVGIKQGMLICPVKMEIVLNGPPSNAGDEWKSFLGPEEKYSIVYGDGTLII